MVMRKVGDRYEHVGRADFFHLCCLMICGCGFPSSRHNFEPAAALRDEICSPMIPEERYAAIVNGTAG